MGSCIDISYRIMSSVIDNFILFFVRYDYFYFIFRGKYIEIDRVEWDYLLFVFKGFLFWGYDCSYLKCLY